MNSSYIFLAAGFEEMEALTVVDVLRRAGMDIKTVSITDSHVVIGSHGIPVTADLLYDKTDFVMPEWLILPGGMPGSRNLDESATVEIFLNYVKENDIPFAAICAAPMVLGKRGMLRGKKAVCYPGFEDYLDGAQVIDAPAVSDGNSVCGRAMGSAAQFALLIIGLLRGEALADTIKSSILL